APEPEVAPVEEPAATQEAAPEAEPAPAVTQEAPAEAPAAEQPAAEPTELPAEEAPAQEAEQTPDVDISADLQAQVDIYNGAVADMMSGGDAAAAQAQISQAQQTISSLCASAGQTDVAACLAGYGLSLPAVPNMPAGDTQEVAPDAAPLDQSVGATTEPAAADAAAPAELAVEPVEDLPEGVTEEQLAPVLDSAKDLGTTPEGAAAVPAEQADPAAA